MSNLKVCLEGEDSVWLDDMGEGHFVFSQRNEDGETERVVMTWGQLQAAVEALAPRYGDGKTQIAA